MGEGWRSSWRVARQRSREGDLEMDIKDCEGSSSSDTGCDWGKMTIKRTNAEAQEANPRENAHR